MYNPTQINQMNQPYNVYQNMTRSSYVNPYTTYNYNTGNKVVGNVNSYNMYSSKVGVTGYYPVR
jgi:hypothetical protein